MRWSLPGALCCIWALILGAASADLFFDAGHPWLLASGYAVACAGCIAGAYHFLMKAKPLARRARHS